MKKHLPFIVFIVVIVGVMIGLIMQQERILTSDDTYVLATRPVDPRDLFRGEYVILRYAIESDPQIRDLLAFATPSDTDIYVQLVPGEDGIAQVATAQFDPPAAMDGWIRGAIQQKRARFLDLEQFYVPEGAGLPIERMRNDLHVEIVLQNGEARIKQLLDKDLAPIDPEDMLPKNTATESDAAIVPTGATRVTDTTEPAVPESIPEAPPAPPTPPVTAE